MGDEGGESLISPDGVVPSRIVAMTASDISHCSRRRSPEEDFFWHQLTRVVPEKGPQNGFVHVCVCVSDVAEENITPRILFHVCQKLISMYGVNHTAWTTAMQ